jgi:hypothetical protein
MGHFSRTAHRTAFRSALGVFGVTIIASGFLFAGADTAAAAKAKAKPGAPAAPVSEAEQKQKDAAQTRQAYEAGIKSYSSGKFQPAVDELSGVLRAGGLSSAEMAKALYVRGMAYKRLSKPGLAISDLTSALWLKNGLGEGDQKNAIAERADSYRMAGLGDGNSGNDAVSVADPNPAPAGAKASAPAVSPPAAPVVATPAVTPKAAKTAAKAAAIAPAAGPTNTPAVTEVTRQAPDSQAAIDAANARKQASTPVETGGLQSAAVGSLIGDQGRASQPAALAAAPVAEVAAAVPAPIPAADPVLAAAPMDATPTTSAATTAGGALNSVSGFFSNMLSGGSKTAAAPADAAPVTTASTTPTASTSSWADSTSVANGASKKTAAAPAVQVAAAAPAAAAPATAAPAIKGGKYKIHIAAVRSKAEAEALAQKLSAQNGAALKSRSPVVDEAVIGSMGTFYRVRVGSYATAEEPRGVCNTLRASGFDCLVVTN